MRRGRIRVLAGLFGAAVLVASCGTTLDQAGDAATAGTRATTADGAPLASTSTTEGAATAGGQPIEGGPAAGTPGGGPASTSGAGPRGVDGRASIGVPSPGVSDDVLDIGVYTAAQAAALFDSLGVKNLQTGDQVNQVRAVVDWINAHGGAGGRRLRIVFHDFDISTAGADPAAEAQAACAAWTQDAKVFAVVAIVGNQTMDQLYSCLANANVIGLANIGQTIDDGFMRRLGDHFYAPSVMNMTRQLRTSIEALGARDFFAPNAPVGVIRYATPEDERAVNEGAIPALEALGLRAEVAVANPSGTGSEYQSIALRFKSLGVRNVVFTWTNTLSFAAAAESLDYHPRWAVTSTTTPVALPANVPASQLQGAMGIGWLPAQDVDAAHDPGPVSERAQLCFDIAADAGEDVSNRTVRAILLLSCDPLMFLKDVLDRAAAPTVADFAVAADSLGTSYRSAATFGTSFGSDRTNDGGAGYRMLRYDASCDCFAYDSGVLAAR